MEKSGYREEEAPVAKSGYLEEEATQGAIQEDMSEKEYRPKKQRRATSTRRLNVVFSEAAYNTIRDLAEQSGKTISDVVRDAIALQKWFIDVRRKGGRILVEERGRVREILNIRYPEMVPRDSTLRDGERRRGEQAAEDRQRTEPQPG